MIILDNIISSLQTTGGVTIYFDNIKDRLLRDKKEVEILNFADVNNTNSRMMQIEPRFLERYRDCRVSFNYNSGIFHSSYYRIPNNKNLKVITTVHDFTYEIFVKGLKQKVHTWQKNRAIRNSNKIICVSNNTAQDLQRFCNVSDDKIEIINNGVSDNYFPLPERLDTNNVIFVGARGGYKNFTLAVQSLAMRSQFNLVIVGGGALTTSEMEMLNHYLPGRYDFRGRLTDDDLNIVYNNAFCLLYPSSYEGFGIPVIEAMRAGCPVVAINSSSIPEVAGDAALLLDKADKNNILEALDVILYERKKLIDRGFEQAKKFSWEKCYQETVSVYNKLS